MVKTLIIAMLSVLIMASHAAWADVIDPTKPMFLKTKKPVVTAKKKTKQVQKKVVVKKKEVPEVYVLTSTLVSRSRSIAVINEQAVTIGDKIGKATVVEINPAQVLLKSGKKDIRLALSTYNVKKTSPSSKQLSPRRLQ